MKNKDYSFFHKSLIQAYLKAKYKLLYKAVKNSGYFELRKGIIKIPFLGPKGHLDDFYSFLLISVRVLRQILLMVFMTRKIKDKKYNKKVFDPRNNLG